MSDEVDKTLVLQRIRNRIIEHLELSSSYEEQENYEISEVINGWEDWVIDSWEKDYVEPVFSIEEQKSLKKFDKVWNNTAGSTPDPLPQMDELFKLKEWQTLVLNAKNALAVFSKRGKFSEDVIQF